MEANTAIAATPPPFVPMLSATLDEPDGLRVAISAVKDGVRGPRMWLGPRTMLWSGAVTYACEPAPLLAEVFPSQPDAAEAAGEVIRSFEWGTPAARARIVEIFDTTMVLVARVGFGPSGLSTLEMVQ